MYQPGRPCSSCPSYSSCSSSYAGLCSAGNAGVSISTTSFNNNKNKNINNNINNSSSYINRNIISRLQSTSLTTSSRIPRQGSNGDGRPRVDLNPKKEEPRRQPRLSRTRTRIIQRRYNTSCNNLFCQIARIFQWMIMPRDSLFLEPCHNKALFHLCTNLSWSKLYYDTKILSSNKTRVVMILW